MNNFDTQNSANNVTGWLDTGLCYSGNKIIKADKAASNCDTAFKSIAADSGVTVPAYFKALGLQAMTENVKEDHIWVNKDDEKIAIRGGRWADGATAGVFALDFNDARSHAGGGIGFRAAYVPR